MNGALILSCIFLICVTGGTANGGAENMFPNCDREMCDELLPKEDILNLNERPPNVEELKRMCPGGIQYLQCRLRHIEECTGLKIVEIIAGVNKSAKSKFGEFISYVDIAIELCDENSELHKGYAKHVECFINLVQERDRSCFEEGERMSAAYNEVNGVLGENDDKERRTPQCVTTIYTVGCSSIKLRKACGEGAQAVFFDFVRRVRPGQFCDIELASVRDNFMAALHAEGDERDTYSDLFEAFGM